MTALATEQPHETILHVRVLRAVPCDAHGSWTAGCPDCLTGEQADALGIAVVEEQTVVAKAHRRLIPTMLRRRG